MRIDTTLRAEQKLMGDAKLRLALTKSGETPYTFYIDSGDDRIRASNHTEQEWSQTAQVTVQDSDATVSALDLKGYQGVLSYGYGSNYSACAPLEVIAQRTPSMSEVITTSFGLAGVFDMMAMEKATEAYFLPDDSAYSIKTVLTRIVQATLACFKGSAGFKPYTITFDSGYDAGDDLANTVQPKDYFRVAAGESRLSAFQKALAFTDLKARVRADGYIHIFAPTISGSTYDEEYQDGVDITRHNFFEKSVRKRLVIPNKIVVSSHPDHEDQYTGSYTDDDSEDALGRIIIGAPVYIRAKDDDQCKAIAKARIRNLQLAAERGHGFVPMNCLQEVMDYVNITDSWAGDSRAGNISYINRRYLATGEPEDFSMEFRFGKGMQGALGMPAIYDEGIVTFAHLRAVMDYTNEVMEMMARWVIDRETVPKWHITEVAVAPTPNYVVR